MLDLLKFVAVLVATFALYFVLWLYVPLGT